MSSMPIRGAGWVVMSMLALAVALPTSNASAQNRNRGSTPAGAPGQPPAPKSAREAAPFDLTGYWVSVVTEDWLERMTMPPKNFIGSLPVNDAARQVAASFDPAVDKAAGQECRPHGAAGNIRSPGRLHITWQNDDTLRIDFSAGTQTRTIPFKPATPSSERTWQGQSVGSWNETVHLRQFAAPARTGRPALRVITTQMRPGYLQKNGMPYSEQAVMTEFFDRFELNGTPWIVVTTQIDDPQYLREPLIWSTQFRKEPDGSKWRPTACGET
jgi:hypothetical protein